jgi:hypothetical protein
MTMPKIRLAFLDNSGNFTTVVVGVGVFSALARSEVAVPFKD